MTVFWGLLIALGVVWTVTTEGEERWWGLGLFGAVSAILLLARWIGLDRESRDP